MDSTDDKASAVAMGPRFIASGGFDALYRQGMALIEEVAAYLDGDGREESRALPRDASFIYATESMRLTTRLMQLASWLLLQRAVHEGEITSENAREEKQKVKFSATPVERGGPGWNDLPPKLVEYIAQGDRLFDRVMQFDKIERGDVEDINRESKRNDVVDQLSRLQAAFGAQKD